MGTWGNTLFWNDEMVTVRQNAAMLVEEGNVTKLANEQESNNAIWGAVWNNSTEFITWRSAIGLDREGNLMIAAGNNLSAKTLAHAMHAAGAYKAMQLDMNTPYVLISLFGKDKNGFPAAKPFMDTMYDKNNAARFLGRQPHDFMYLTLDETNFQWTPARVIKPEPVIKYDD